MLTQNLTFLKVYTLISTVTYIVVNSLIGSGVWKVGSGSNKVVSDKYYTMITPSGWAFAIWSVLFLFQGAWAIYQVLPVRNQEKSEIIRAFSVFLPIAFHFQTLWPIIFCYEQLLLSFFVILLGWSFMLIAYLRVQEVYAKGRLEEIVHGVRTGLGQNSVYVSLGASEKVGHLFEWITSRVPTAINLGWVTIASFVNFASVLVYYKKSPGEAFSIVLLVVAGVLTLVISVMKKDAFVPLPVAWGAAAIRTAHHSHTIDQVCIALIAVLLVDSFCFWSYSVYRGLKTRDYSHSRLISEDEF